MECWESSIPELSLGERLNGIQEVVGSIPISSTNLGINIAGVSGLLVGTANPLTIGFFLLVTPHRLKKQQWNVGNQAFQKPESHYILLLKIIYYAMNLEIQQPRDQVINLCQAYLHLLHTPGNTPYSLQMD